MIMSFIYFVGWRDRLAIWDNVPCIRSTTFAWRYKIIKDGKQRLHTINALVVLVKWRQTKLGKTPECAK
jgi:hypothetical protein